MNALIMSEPEACGPEEHDADPFLPAAPKRSSLVGLSLAYAAA
jgi:hypothetical protein